MICLGLREFGFAAGQLQIPTLKVRLCPHEFGLTAGQLQIRSLVICLGLRKFGFAAGQLQIPTLKVRLCPREFGASGVQIGQRLLMFAVLGIEVLFEPPDILPAVVEFGLACRELSAFLSKLFLCLRQLRPAIAGVIFESLGGLAALVEFAGEAVQFRLPGFQFAQGATAFGLVRFALGVDFSQLAGQLSLALGQSRLSLCEVCGGCPIGRFAIVTIGCQLGQSVCQRPLALGQFVREFPATSLLLAQRQFVCLARRLPLICLVREIDVLPFDVLLVSGERLPLGIEVRQQFGQFGLAPLKVGERIFPLRRPAGVGGSLNLPFRFQGRELRAKRVLGLIGACGGRQHLRKPLTQFTHFCDQAFRPVAHLRPRPILRLARSLFCTQRPVRPARGFAAAVDDLDFDRTEAQSIAGDQARILEGPSIEPCIAGPRTSHHAMVAAQDQAVQRTDTSSPQPQCAFGA